MKLSQLKNMLTFSTDFIDNEIDASFYTELDDILPKYADTIDVKAIDTHYIICDFYNFIFAHKKEINDYLYDVYAEPWASDMTIGMFDNKDAEYLGTFIEKDMDDFLRGDY